MSPDFGFHDRPLDDLINTLRDPDASQRLRAALALSVRSATDLVALPALIEALRDTNAHCRQTAALALGCIGRPARIAGPALVAALQDQDRGVRRRAAAALARLGITTALFSRGSCALGWRPAGKGVRCAFPRGEARFGGGRVSHTPPGALEPCIPLCHNTRAEGARERTMSPEYQIQRAELAGRYWTTIWRGAPAAAAAVLDRQIRLYSVGRFRLVDGDGQVVEERAVKPLFGGQ
jgi:hypothetical protein